jgi:hypothetical protein
MIFVGDYPGGGPTSWSLRAPTARVNLFSA